jgi:steroid delta-isomerase-like uncharacterized protein
MTTEGAGRPSTSLLRDVARRFEDAWNAHDVQRVADVFAEDAVLEDPAPPEGVVRGRGAIREYFGAWQRAFPDTQMRQEALFAPLDDGDEYATRWRIWGTMHQPLDPPGFAPTHARVETEGVAIIELRGELISRCRQFYDTTQVARQLGAAPPRGSALDKVGVVAQRLSVAVRQRMRR